jgi:hypothetical protein
MRLHPMASTIDDRGQSEVSLSQEEEARFRESLLSKARKGDVKAKQELQEVYGVRLWPEQERAALVIRSPRTIIRLPVGKQGMEG